MKVFLSWSGKDSQAVAVALHAWLPTVVHTVRPYVSAENIDKGERWSLDIAKQLEDTNFGVIVMTPENIVAPWILFEAGALSKSIERSRVSPLLFELSPSDFANSPLLQFQLTMFKKDDFRKLLNSMNNSAPENEKLSIEVLNKSFNRAWNELEDEIKKIKFSKPSAGVSPSPATPKDDKLDKILEELLTIARTQIKILRSPEEILPVDYLREIVVRARAVSDRIASDNAVPEIVLPSHMAWTDLDEGIRMLSRCILKMPSTLEGDFKNELMEGLRLIERAGRYLIERMGPSRNLDWHRDDFDDRHPLSRFKNETNRPRDLPRRSASSSNKLED